MRKLTLILSVAMLATPVLADDLPEFQPWWRGEVSTTLQRWEFDTPDQVNVLPDGPGPLDEGPPYQVGYLPSTMVTEIRPFQNEPWIEEDPFAPTGAPGRFGIWMLSGEMDVLVDNHDPDNDRKLINVQLTWHPGEIGALPGIKDIGPEQYPVRDFQHVGDIASCNGWITSLYTWEFEGNPADEWFTIYGNVYVDQLVVDTWCIPEPATMGLMATGGLFALLRRRRK